MIHQWEIIESAPDVPYDRIRRLKVPGGWLYQVGHEAWLPAEGNEDEGCWSPCWHPPVFVRESGTD